MTKEQLELAKVIEKELIQIEVAIKNIMELPQPRWDGINVNLLAICLKYKVDTLQVFTARKAELEAELLNL